MTQKNENTLEIEKKGDETRAEIISRVALNPIIKASMTICEADLMKEPQDLMASINALTNQCVKGRESIILQSEPLLTAQAHALDTIFHKYIKMAFKQSDGKNIKILADLAFKAQNQTRMTLATLQEIKNPKPYIQNNKAQYQQVNNGDTPSRAREENSNSSNELLEDQCHEQEWMDGRTQKETVRDDQDMEALGTKHGR